MQDSAPDFVEPVKGSIFVAAGKSAKFSFRFTGDFDEIDFGLSVAGSVKTVAIRVTKGTPLSFQYLPEYSGRISWAGKENVSPKEAVFILSNVSQSDSRKYGCTITRDVIVKTRTVDLIVTGKILLLIYVLYCKSVACYS